MARQDEGGRRRGGRRDHRRGGLVDDRRPADPHEKDEAERLLELEKELHKKVVSQKEAVKPSAGRSAARAAD
jgi:hypothetical protein